MMKSLRLVVVAELIAFVFCSVPLFAQLDDALSDPLNPQKDPPRIYLGPLGGFNQNFHTGGFTSFVPGVECPNFTTGDATGFYLGGSFEYLLGDPKDARSSLLARIMWDDRPASFAERDEEPLPSRVFDEDGNERRVLSSTEHIAEITYNLINLDLLYKLNVGSTPIALAAGPSIGMVLDAQVEQLFNLLDPLEGRFIRDESLGFEYRNFDRTIVIRDDDVPDHSKLRIGLKVGLMYEISVKKLIVVPGLWYDFGVTKVTSDENWRVNTLQAGVDVRFAI